MPTLSDALAERVVVMDGGIATELERRGHVLNTALWSAALLAEQPDAIRDVHRAFFAAGAEVATTASYQGSLDGFAALDLDGAALLRRSVEIAVEARDEHGSGWVAASIGPYGATLADGSEYRGDYGLDVGALREFHRPRLELLAAAGADVLAVETIPCLVEVEALVVELDAIGVPAWLSVSASAGRTRAGEPLADAFAIAGHCDAVFAVGVNCLEPAEVAAAVATAAQCGKPVVAYPNSGERWDGRARAWIGPAAFDPSDVLGWTESGARLVGGCCRVGPDEITAVAAAVHTRP